MNDESGYITSINMRKYSTCRLILGRRRSHGHDDPLIDEFEQIARAACSRDEFTYDRECRACGVGRLAPGRRCPRESRRSRVSFVSTAKAAASLSAQGDFDFLGAPRRIGQSLSDIRCLKVGILAENVLVGAPGRHLGRRWCRRSRACHGCRACRPSCGNHG